MRTVEITWGCHPVFLVTFEIAGGNAHLMRVSRLKDDETVDPSLVTADAFERVMGEEAIADMESDAREKANDEDEAERDRARDMRHGGRL